MTTPPKKSPRKRKRTGEPKSERIDIHLTEEGYKLIAAAAALGEEAVLGYARRVLLAHAREDLAKNRRGVARDIASKVGGDTDVESPSKQR